MRLATVRDGTRDGMLVVVDRTGTRQATAAGVAASLQAALDDWSRCAPALDELARGLDRDQARGQPLDVGRLGAPLPRAFEWIDGSAYLNHIRLVRQARGAKLPATLETEPLVYQGGSGALLGPTDALPFGDPKWGLDFESELCVVVGDVPRGVDAAAAGATIRLLMVANDVTLRNLVPAELAKGFGFFNAKPATAFSPMAVTPDQLGTAFRGGRAYLHLRSTYNGSVVGDTETGPEMHFSFPDLIAHAARTRALTAGTIIGSGTVSNQDRARGVSCLVERRTIETIEQGAPHTPYMKSGDTIRIEAVDDDGRSVCGAIEQRVL